ncbi:MAG: CvpA family protein [Rhodospirillaceae bacterium]
MQGLPVNGLDLAVGAILLISALIAFIRGFVHEVLSIAAWIGAVAAVVYGFPFVQPHARGLIPINWAADAAAAVGIFILVLLILSIATHAVARAIQKSALGNLDRSLGFVFGIARAVVILAVGLVITDWLTERERPRWIETAKTLPVIEMAAEGLVSALPRSLMPPVLAPKPAALIKAEDAIHTAKTLERLNRPAPAVKASDSKEKTTEAGYQNQERRDIERLMNSTLSPETTAPHE